MCLTRVTFQGDPARSHPLGSANSNQEVGCGIGTGVLLRLAVSARSSGQRRATVVVFNLEV
eukprot:6481202-Amphidinium_carterae.2